MAPSGGKGLGMGSGIERSRSSAPVSRPTALRSPHKSPSPQHGGLVGGARWVDLRTGCPPRAAQRGRGCASSPGAARAAKPPASPERRRPCGRRATKRKRLARRSSRCEHFSGVRGPATGMAGARGGDLAGQARSAADHDRPVRQAGPFTRSVKEDGPRSQSTGGPHPKHRVRSTPRRRAATPRGCCPGGPGGTPGRAVCACHCGGIRGLRESRSHEGAQHVRLAS